MTTLQARRITARVCQTTRTLTITLHVMELRVHHLRDAAGIAVPLTAVKHAAFTLLRVEL